MQYDPVRRPACSAGHDPELVIRPEHTGSATQNTPNAPSTLTGLYPDAHWVGKTGAAETAASAAEAGPTLQPKTPDATTPQ